MATKQATHLVPLDGVSIHIMAAENGGFVVLTNCGNFFEGGGGNSGNYIPRSGAAFSTAEECGSWVLSVLKNVTHKKFGAKESQRS